MAERPPSRLEAHPGVEFFMGVGVDHLYADCPSLRGRKRKGVGTVDPHGTDICGLCVRRWNRKNPVDLMAALEKSLRLGVPE